MSSSSRPYVLITEGSDPRPLQWLKERAEVVLLSSSDVGFDEALSRTEGMIVRTYTRVTDALLAKAPNLKVVGRAGVGLDNIDVAACRARGVEVVYTPDANTLAVGDYVIGALLRLVRGWPTIDANCNPAWFKRVRAELRGRQLNELVLGILGLGRIGKRVGAIAANGFGMRVIYNDLVDPGPLAFPATAVDKSTLYRECDALTIHVDMRPGNENLIAAEQIRQMKPGSVVINASRGEVLSASAVVEALKSNHLAGAALDVYHPEPPPPDFPLIGLPNVILTPHIAARTYTGMENMAWVVRDVMAVLEGRRPEFLAPPAPVKT